MAGLAVGFFISGVVMRDAELLSSALPFSFAAFVIFLIFYFMNLSRDTFFVYLLASAGSLASLASLSVANQWPLFRQRPLRFLLA